MIIAGLDVAFSNDFMALVIVDKAKDGKIRLGHLATWRKFDWPLWKEEIKIKYFKFYISTIYVDDTNNKTVGDELRTMGMRVEKITFTNTIKNDMIANAVRQMSTGILIMPVVEKIH